MVEREALAHAVYIIGEVAKEKASHGEEFGWVLRLARERLAQLPEKTRGGLKYPALTVERIELILEALIHKGLDRRTAAILILEALNETP